ncbi:MAG: hypothetical protein ACLP9L_24890 [Thermoguttaceae bacterium]
MSRKLVFLSAFLAALPMLLVSANARGDDPPKNVGGMSAQRKEPADAIELFGNDDNPFGGPVDAKPTVSTPPQKPHVEPAKSKVEPTKPKADPARPKPYSGPALHGGEKAILKALKQKASLDFVKTPLKDALDFLSKKHLIPIRIDSPALKEAGLDDGTPVTCKLSGIPLRSALEIILDDLQLKWVIHHDVLIITSPTKAESDEYMYTKSYDVTDLLATAEDYELQNPLCSFNEPALDHGPMGQLSGAAGGGTGIHGGMPAASNNRQPIEDLLTTSVATKTWMDNGGTGSMVRYDRMLIISQTREVHMEIEQFFADLRARRQERPTLSVELHWLWLDAKHRDHLLAGRLKPSEGQLSLTVDRQRLRQIAREVPGFHGRVACVSGLGTVIAAGDRRAIILSTIPVVGVGIGYQPIISVPNVGVTAQLRPTFVPGTKTATLDIASIITRWDPSRKPAIIGAAWSEDKQVVDRNDPPAPVAAKNAANAGPATPPQPVVPSNGAHSAQGGTSFCPVDQPVMPTQQIGTMLRVPLGKAVIVGAITFAPAEDAGLAAAKENPVEVYVIATTSIVRDAAR